MKQDGTGDFKYKPARRFLCYPWQTKLSLQLLFLVWAAVMAGHKATIGEGGWENFSICPCLC